MASKLVSLYDMMRLDAKPFYEIGGWLKSLRVYLYYQRHPQHPDYPINRLEPSVYIRQLLDAIASVVSQK
jgi:hypothetical protein